MYQGGLRVLVLHIFRLIRFRGLARLYYKDADAIVLVFDVTDAMSFIDIPDWLQESVVADGDHKTIVKILVGNKVKE